MDHALIFAPNGGYFVRGSGFSHSNNLPGWCDDVLKSAAEVYCLAFGPGGAAVITFLDAQTGQVQLKMRDVASMPGLAGYLLERHPLSGLARNLRSLQVSFGGREGAYWASDGHSSVHHGLPHKLEHDLAMYRQTRGGPWLDMPRVVALGADDNYFVATMHGATWWHLARYPQLAHALQELEAAYGSGTSVQNVHLNCFDGCSAILTSGGQMRGFNIGAEPARHVANLNNVVHARQLQEMAHAQAVQQDMIRAQVEQQARFRNELVTTRWMHLKEMDNLQWAGLISLKAGHSYAL